MRRRSTRLRRETGRRKNQSSEEELAGGRLVGGSLFSLEGPEERLAGDYSPLVAAEHLYRIVCGSLVIFRIGRVKDCCFFSFETWRQSDQPCRIVS